MSFFGEDSVASWAALHKTITDYLGGEPTGAIIQPFAISERADWDSPNPLLNAYRELRIANQVPTWNPLYIPNTGVDVADEYQAFLDQLNSKLIDESGVPDKDALKALESERWNVQDRLQKNEWTINRQWDRYVANHNGKPPLPRPQWEVDFGFAATRKNLQREVEQALAAYMRVVNDAGGELLEVGRALSALADPRQKIPLPQDDQDALLPAENWQYWYRAGLQDDINRFLQDEDPFTITISEREEHTRNFEERWGASARVGWFGLFGFGGGTSNEIIKRHSEEQTSQVKIHFANIQPFPIIRGNWFKAGLISTFRDRMPPTFWGEGGRLNLIPASLTLVRGTAIEVQTSREVTDYYFNKRVTGGGGGFRIGPFSFGGSGSRTTIHEHTDFHRTENGFVIEDKSGRAQVLAVTSIRQADLVHHDIADVMPMSSRMSIEEMHKGRMLVNQARTSAVGGVGPLLGEKKSGVRR